MTFYPEWGITLAAVRRHSFSGPAFDFVANVNGFGIFECIINF
jgi:hypothetical protein